MASIWDVIGLREGLRWRFLFLLTSSAHLHPTMWQSWSWRGRHAPLGHVLWSLLTLPSWMQQFPLITNSTGDCLRERTCCNDRKLCNRTKWSNLHYFRTLSPKSALVVWAWLIWKDGRLIWDFVSVIEWVRSICVIRHIWSRKLWVSLPHWFFSSSQRDDSQLNLHQCTAMCFSENVLFFYVKNASGLIYCFF